MLIVFAFLPLAFTALLPLINPIGSALVFLGLVGLAPPEVYRRLARKIAISTTLFLLTVDLVGAGILTFFGISLPIVQVAGGLVLTAMGWRLLNENGAAKQSDASSSPVDASALDEQVFYPFTFPVTAGPGSVVVMLTLSAHASRRSLINAGFAHLGLLGGIVLISLTVYLSYAYCRRITSKISAQTIHGILRVIAFIVLCIGVQIAWNGLEELIRTVERR